MEIYSDKGQYPITWTTGVQGRLRPFKRNNVWGNEKIGVACLLNCLVVFLRISEKVLTSKKF